MQHITLRKMYIHHIFAANSTNATGLRMKADNQDSSIIRDVLIEDCEFEMTGHRAIWIFGAGVSPQTSGMIRILNNQMVDIGGPGMVPGNLDNVIVRGNTVIRSGSHADPRMHQRGSCIWPWETTNVLIENNIFRDVQGPGDSHGAHIDFGCSNVLIQRNLCINLVESLAGSRSTVSRAAKID